MGIDPKIPRMIDSGALMNQIKLNVFRMDIDNGIGINPSMISERARLSKSNKLKTANVFMRAPFLIPV